MKRSINLTTRLLRITLTALLAVALPISTPSRAADPEAMEELNTIIKSMTAEGVAGQIDTVINHVHPSIIELAGGEEKAKTVLPPMMRGDFAMVAKLGFKVTSYEAGEPQNVRTDGEWTVALIPTTLIAEGKRGKFTSKSHTLATRKSGPGAKWHLLRLGYPEARIRQMVPELPADYKLPARQQPKLEKR